MSHHIALIIEADEPALFYQRIQDAEIDLEVIDVNAGVYKSALGPNGEIYRISSSGEKVIIEKIEDQYDKKDLRRIIINFLSKIGKSPGNYEGISTSELLERCAPYAE